jgi:hypothetical protein
MDATEVQQQALAGSRNQGLAVWRERHGLLHLPEMSPVSVVPRKRHTSLPSRQARGTSSCGWWSAVAEHHYRSLLDHLVINACGFTYIWGGIAARW